MSATFFYILFCVFLLNLPHQLRVATAAHIEYNDYNYLDTADKDLNEYLENLMANKKTRPLKDQFEYNGERNINEPNYIDDNYPSECEPSSTETTTQSTTTTSSSTLSPSQYNSSTTHGPATTTTSAKPNFVTSDNDALKEAQDIIDHVTRLIKSMRVHVMALIKNMNELETDILSSNSTDLNATNFEDESTMYGMKKITYPDILSQKTGYHVINEWSAPIPTGAQQTNEFMEEAQEAVRSWKHEIENCKRILDSAINKALETSNLKSNLLTETIDKRGGAVSGQRKLETLNHKVPVNPSIYAMVQPVRELKQLDKYKNIHSNGQHKYNGLYDALHYKNRGY